MSVFASVAFYQDTQSCSAKNMGTRSSVQQINRGEFHERTTKMNEPTNGCVTSNVNHAEAEKNQCRELTVDQVPTEFKEMFVMSGYRRPYSSAKECFLSVFQTSNNECVNVWTHLVPLLWFIVYFGRIISSLSLSDPYNYPLICFAFSICGFCSMSCGAHTFNSMSPRLRHVCFFFDYAAIAIHCFGASQVFIYYARPANTQVLLYSSPKIFLTISFCICLSANFLCCASRHRWLSLKYIVRTVPFVITFLYIVSPVVWRTFTCDDPIDCNFESLPYYKRHAWFYIVSAIINIARVPERFTPGTFDIFGNSHHFLHVFTALGAADEFKAIYSDMLNRREILPSDHGPTIYNSIGLVAVFSVLNIAVVLYFAYRLKSDKEEANTYCYVGQNISHVD